LRNLSPGRKTILTSAASRYHEALAEHPTVTAYLAGRGVEASTVTVFQLGVVDSPEPEHAPYVGMVSIPYLTKTGCVGFKFRHADNHHQPKYLIPPGQGLRMFNPLATLGPSPWIVVTEGELDCVIASQCGLPAIGVPGVQAWRKHHPRVLDGFERIIVLADNDEKEDGSNPGHELARKIVDDMPQAEVAWLPRGSDVTDVFLSGGRGAVIELLPEGLRECV